MSRLVVGRMFIFPDQIIELSDKVWGDPDDHDDPLEVLVRINLGLEVGWYAWMWIRADVLSRVLFPTEVESCTATVARP